MKYFKDIISGSISVIKGFAVTIKVFFKKPITVQYPDEKVNISPRFRGRLIQLTNKETGEEICDACGICAKFCPVQCISLKAYKDEVSGKRRTEYYNIDFGRCMFCGICVEQCPKKCLVHSQDYEFAVYSRDELTHTKEKILVK